MNEVINYSSTEMTAEHREAVETHKRIMANGEVIASSWTEMCADLKKMRDNKLYEEFGYSSFEEYTEKMVGIKARQAYTYISTYENLGSTVLQSNASLGITKLSLLCDMNPGERTDLLEGGELEGMSVAQIKELVKNAKDQGEQMSLMQAENESLKTENESLKSELDNDDDEYDAEADGMLSQKDAEIDRLKAQLAEIQNESDAPSSSSEISEAEKLDIKKQVEAELKAEQKDKVDSAIEKEKKKLEAEHRKELDEAVKKAKAEAQSAADKKIEILTSAITENEKQAAELQKQLELSDSKSTTAMVYIQAVQNDFNNLFTVMADMTEEQQNKFKGACIKLLNMMKQKCEE